MLSATARAAVLTVGLALLGTAPAVAQPSSPAPTGTPQASIEVPDPVPGEEVCTIADHRMQELSGMAVLDDGTLVVLNDGRPAAWEAQPIFFLDQHCQVIDEVRFPEPGQRDPEDMQLDHEAGVLWVGDIGDNVASGTSAGEPRQSVALWRVDLQGDRTPVIHRLAYPDGPQDAETLILDGDGTPIILTREIGASTIYRPAAPLVANNPHEQAVPLEKVGQWRVPDTGADFPPLPVLGRQVITGGDTSPQRDRVVLRSFTDAFEFDVEDGDVVKAILEGTPRVTPLPGEPWGEAIAYTPDGEHFMTVSEGVNPTVLRYEPTAPAPEPAVEEAADTDAAPARRSLLDRLGWQGILNLVAAVGVIGLVMVGVGVYGIVKARRQPPDDPDSHDDDDPDWDDDGDGHQVPRRAGPVSARARVTPRKAARPDGPPYPPEPGRPSRAAGPASARGTVYGAGAVYQEHLFDQDAPDGYADGSAAGAAESPRSSGGTYRGGTYQSAGTYAAGGEGGAQPQGRTYGAGRAAEHYEYDDGYQPQPYDQYGGGYPSEGHQSPEYRAEPDDVPDYYYDDPDYSYEFRDRGY